MTAGQREDGGSTSTEGGQEGVAVPQHQLVQHVRQHRLQHERRPAGTREARH